MSLSAAAVLAVLVVGVIARCSRRRFLQANDAFRCRIRACGYTSAIWPRLRLRWSRPMWAVWIEDVLVVRRGPVFARVIPIRAQIGEAGVCTLTRRDVRWCGSDPIAVGLRVWDGSRMEVAAAEDTRLALVGPYLVAAVNDRPQAPLRRRQI